MTLLPFQSLYLYDNLPALYLVHIVLTYRFSSYDGLQNSQFREPKDQTQVYFKQKDGADFY